MIKIGIVGVGRWGPNLLRNFDSMDGVQVSMVCDTDQARIDQIKKRFPDVQTSNDPAAVCENADLDCAVIATPLATHFELAQKALRTGQHVFVEKPLAASSRECRELIDIAEDMNVLLFVGHTFKYNASIRAAKEFIKSGELGDIYLIDANRTNLGPVRYDTNALWDLASHDISIFSYWLDENPKSVSARGGRFLNSNIEDVVYSTFEYSNGVVAHVHASWLNPRKIREITVVGEKKMLVWNDMNLSEPIRIYNKGFVKDEEYHDTFASFRLSIREGEVIIPTLRLNEPLWQECDHFISCVKDGTRPLTDGYDGLNVVRALEAATESMQSQGTSIAIEHD